MNRLDIIKIVLSLGALLWTSIKGIPATIRFGKRVLDGIDTIKDISEQFKNNGGATIKDSIDRLESLMIIERERNRAASTLLPAGMFETNDEGLTTWVSSKYTELTGAALEDAKGLNWAARIHEEDRGKVLEDWWDAVMNERRSVTNYRMVTHDGVKHLLVEVFPIHNRNKFIGHIGLVCLTR